jgi:PAS domain-containing protein
LPPTALVADVKFADSRSNHSISTLRKRLSCVPIIALGSGSHELASRRMLDQGADAYLPREELHRPTLYDLLQRIQREPNATSPLDHPVLPRMAVPWQKSRIVGVLVCDIAGTIVDVNHCLARWLEYSTKDEIIGKYVWGDILISKSEWSAWRKIAGDLSALLHQSTTVKARNGQLLWAKLEVFAAPSSASYLQAIFVDQTEIALLTNRTLST